MRYTNWGTSVRARSPDSAAVSGRPWEALDREGARSGWRFWACQAAVAVGYFLLYAGAREISFSHWSVQAGLRVVCLLLLPYRYWPALLIGEALPMVKLSYDCMDQFGALWGWTNFPPMLIAMPVVWFFRSRLGLNPAEERFPAGKFLACAIVLSTLIAMYNALHLATAVAAQRDTTPLHEWASRYLLGNYLGMLTVAPSLFVLWHCRGDVRHAPRALGHSRLAMDSLLVLIPAMTLLVWAGTSLPAEASQITRMAMFVPVAWLTLRHGWRGAALGTTAASVAIVLTMPAIYDLAVLQAQVFMALAATTLLLLGSRLGATGRPDPGDLLLDREAMQLARQSLFLSELRMRQTAHAVELIGDTVQHAHNRLLGRLRHLLPAVEERGYSRQAAAAQQQVYRLADSLYPKALKSRGLAYALREGSIRQATEELGIAYRCQLDGAHWDDAASATQMTLYRLACEAVVYLCAQRADERLTLKGRSGVGPRGVWLVLQVEGRHDPSCQGQHSSTERSWESLLSRLGASGMGVGSIRDRARLYAGTVHLAARDGLTRISLLIHDTPPGR